jgi:hypothetical protein
MLRDAAKRVGRLVIVETITTVPEITDAILSICSSTDKDVRTVRLAIRLYIRRATTLMQRVRLKSEAAKYILADPE